MAVSSNFTLDGIEATRALGRRLAALLCPGETVLLHGDLGAGKTTLARAIIYELCGVEDAPSPTYTLVQTYDTESGDILVHADLYRIEAAQELDELGLDEAFDEAITLVEWPDRLGGLCPQNRLEIALTVAPGADGARREARLTGFGTWEERVEDD